ncbi:DUF3817 domain-containing protein [bacterium]|nr:DUF3817 domain-containing protein [bacterium]
MNNNSPVIRGFRAVAFAEGISFLLLLGVAMPLKYMAGMPMAVKIAGSLHGFLFLAYMVAAYLLFTELKWPMKRAPGVFLAAVLPFGTFVLERKWLKQAS